MTNKNLMETIAEVIKTKIIDEWKHDGSINWVASDTIAFCIDDKRYRLELTAWNVDEVQNAEASVD